MSTRARLSPTIAAFALSFAFVHAASAEVCGTWSPVPVPGGANQPLKTVSASSASDAWAVWRGVFHWNGAAWSAVPAPGRGSPDTVFWGVAAVAPNDAWIVGYTAFLGTPQTLTERWDGTRWNVVPSPVIPGGSHFEAVSALGPNDVWAVGLRAGGLPQFQATSVPLTAHWNGSAWTVVPAPEVANRSHELRDVAAIAPDDVWAVGSSRNLTENYRSLILHWNGAAWSVVPAPSLPGENILHGVSGTASNDAWAVGLSWDGVTARQIFLHWDGSAWTQVPGLEGATVCAGCTGDVLALGPDDVWAVGSNVGHWDGTAWSLVPTPTVPGATGVVLRGLARIGPCEAWSVGGSFDADGVESALAVRLVPGGGTTNLPPVAQASADPASGPGPLTVQFRSTGSHDDDGTIVSYRWNFGDGALSESSDPDPVHTFVQTGALTYHVTLVVTDDRGAIAQASTVVRITPPIHVEEQSVTRETLAGGSWRARNDLLVTDHEVEPVVGAIVTASYSGPSSGVLTGTTGADGRVILASPPATDPNATWCFDVVDVAKDGHVYTPASNAVTRRCEGAAVGVGDVPVSFALSVQPNPFRDVASIGLALPAAGRASVVVVDVSGALVRTLASGPLAAGNHVFRWDGRDTRGHTVAAGVYFITAMTPDRRMTLRTLRLR